MKTTQTWGWLAAGVLAAGLNASYHDGGLQAIHQVAAQVEHRAAAVLALATGRADQFLAEGRLVTAGDETASCQLSTALAWIQSRIARSETGVAHFEAISAREEGQLARVETNRARIEAQLTRMRIPAVAFNPVVVNAPRIECRRIRVSIPRPLVRIPAIHVDVAGLGPV
jgi:hypothetical protein